MQGCVQKYAQVHACIFKHRNASSLFTQELANSKPPALIEMNWGWRGDRLPTMSGPDDLMLMSSVLSAWTAAEGRHSLSSGASWQQKDFLRALKLIDRQEKTGNTRSWEWKQPLPLYKKEKKNMLSSVSIEIKKNNKILIEMRFVLRTGRQTEPGLQQPGLIN